MLDADRARIAAGIAALEGQGADALAGFIDAIRAYEQLGLSFEAAAAVVDMVVVLPAAVASPPAAEAIATARATLTRLGAAPFLARLESGAERKPSGSGAASPGIELAPTARN